MTLKKFMTRKLSVIRPMKLTFQLRSLSIISARQHLWTVDDYHRMGETVTNYTRSNDLIKKRRIYAEAQIREYWVLDVKNRRVIVFRNPSGGNYQEKIVLKEDETFSLLAFPDVCVSLNQLFPLFS